MVSIFDVCACVVASEYIFLLCSSEGTIVERSSCISQPLAVGTNSPIVKSSICFIFVPFEVSSGKIKKNSLCVAQHTIYEIQQIDDNFNEKWMMKSESEVFLFFMPKKMQSLFISTDFRIFYHFSLRIKDI